MKLLLLPLLCCVLLASPASARVGETRAECVQRYGEPTKTNKFLEFDTLLFTKSGFTVLIMMDTDGRAGGVRYEHGKKDEFEVFLPEITAAELETLLAANAGGQKWVQNRPRIGSKGWTTADKSRIAVYDEVERHLIVSTIAFENKLSAAHAAAQKKKIEGL